MVLRKMERVATTFQSLLDMGEMPEDLKMVSMTPFLKQSVKTLGENYRPIISTLQLSLEHFSGYGFRILIREKINSHSERFELI